MDYLAFSHGQTQSKQWLCETLEPYLPKSSNIAILGSWYNILGFMILTRSHYKCQSILGIDIDPEATAIANQICQGWAIGKECKLSNITADANKFKLEGYNVVINCSSEHMKDSTWLSNIDDGAIVCLQTSNVDIPDGIWKISNPTHSLEDFKNKYPLSHIIMSGTKNITYDTWGYERYMIIGVK